MVDVKVAIICSVLSSFCVIRAFGEKKILDLREEKRDTYWHGYTNIRYYSNAFFDTCSYTKCLYDKDHNNPNNCLKSDYTVYSIFPIKIKFH